jgi:hypothetical protein
VQLWGPTGIPHDLEKEAKDLKKGDSSFQRKGEVLVWFKSQKIKDLCK